MFTRTDCSAWTRQLHLSLSTPIRSYVKVLVRELIVYACDVCVCVHVYVYMCM